MNRAIKITMSLTVGINNYDTSFWRDSDNEYIGLVPMPGVSNANVIQKGRMIYIDGKNDQLKVSYSYTVLLHTDSSDTPVIREEHGMVIISCPKISKIERRIVGSPAPVGCIRIGPQ